MQIQKKNNIEWFINNIQLIQRGQEVSNKGDHDTPETEETSTYSENSIITTKSNSKRIGWKNLRYSLSSYNEQQLDTIENLVLLDSNSTNTIFSNEQYVTNIR